MKNVTELLTAYLAQIQDPAAAPSLFADDGVVELPWLKAPPQGPVEIKQFLAGLLAKVSDFSFQNIRIWIKTPDQAFAYAGRLVREKGLTNTNGLHNINA
jgi:hypothetical protein